MWSLFAAAEEKNSDDKCLIKSSNFSLQDFNSLLVIPLETDIKNWGDKPPTSISLLNEAISYAPFLSQLNLVRTKQDYSKKTLEIAKVALYNIGKCPSENERRKFILEALEKMLDNYDPSSTRTGGYIRKIFKEFLGMTLPSALTELPVAKNEFARRKDIVYRHFEIKKEEPVVFYNS